MIENKNIEEQIKLVAKRIKEMREILEISVERVAAALNISAEQYLRYENCEDNIPINIIYGVAQVFNVDSTTLLTGDAPRMVDYTVVRGGNGIEIERCPGYSFSSLAINYIGRTMDPMIVTLKSDDKPADLIQHNGQEFNYVIEGTIIVKVGPHEFELNAGDSIYFNPSLLHGQRAKSPVARFLTVLN